MLDRSSKQIIPMPVLRERVSKTGSQSPDELYQRSGRSTALSCVKLPIVTIRFRRSFPPPKASRQSGIQTPKWLLTGIQQRRPLKLLSRPLPQCRQTPQAQHVQPSHPQKLRKWHRCRSASDRQLQGGKTHPHGMQLQLMCHCAK